MFSTLNWLHARSQLSGMGPEKAADSLRKLVGQSLAPIQVELMVQAMGIQLHFVTERRWSGAVNSSELGRTAAMWVRNDAKVRRRFTMAHELGHLMLHPLGVMFRDDTFSGDEREVEANKFAAALLMPREFVVSDYHATRDVKMLARRYVVSESAMRIRLHVLVGLPMMGEPPTPPEPPPRPLEFPSLPFRRANKLWD